MEYPEIIYTKEEGIATITLNRPERMNAFNADMVDSIQRALKDASADDEVRVIVITGAGRGFCAGADLKGPRNRVDGSSHQNRVRRGVQMPMIFSNIDKPIIGCINGPAIGWGLELALLCDIRIASENARLADPHVTIGVINDNGGAYYLPRLVGWAKACELTFTGKPIDGKEAERIGLVNKAVPSDRLQAETYEMAKTLANQPPMALQLNKRAMINAQTSDLNSSQDYVVLLFKELLAAALSDRNLSEDDSLIDVVKTDREKQTK